MEKLHEGAASEDTSTTVLSCSSEDAARQDEGARMISKHIATYGKPSEDCSMTLAQGHLLQTKDHTTRLGEFEM